MVYLPFRIVSEQRYDLIIVEWLLYGIGKGILLIWWQIYRLGSWFVEKSNDVGFYRHVTLRYRGK